MAKIKKGDKIRIKSNDKTGIIENIYDLGYWNLNEDQYSIKMDDGSGLVTISSDDCEKIEDAPPINEPKCICGVKYLRDGGKHSHWCEIKEE